MKYISYKLNEAKAVIEIIPEKNNEKALFDSMNENNLEDNTLHYYYSLGLKRISAYAELLGIECFITFPTKATISFGLAIGFGN